MWYRYDMRVRYQETDRMGVVYHANYLNWFEIGRTETIRAAGMTYRELEERGLLLPVTEADLRFRLPARYDDTVAIYTRVESFSGIRLAFANEIRRVAVLTPEAEESPGERGVTEHADAEPDAKVRRAAAHGNGTPLQPLREGEGRYRLGAWPVQGEPEGELLVTGGTRHVWVNPAWKPIRIDREAPDLFRLLEERWG